MAKKRRIPEILWRLFGNRARTLAHTIIALTKQSPPSRCRCKITTDSCLLCSGEENAMSFLIQPNDPSDYRNLLNQCFVVINDDAPAPLLSDFSLDNRWSQRQIVKRTIEMISSEQSVTSNVICGGQDQSNQSSHIVGLLTAPAWGLLLERVGDDVMVYLLKYSSIFLPLPHKKHHQVAGPPISDLCLKSQHQHPSIVQFGTQKKRKRVDNVGSIFKTLPENSSLSSCDNSSFIPCVGSNCTSSFRPHSSHHGYSHGQLIFSRRATPTNAIDAFENKADSDRKPQQSSDEVTAKSRKRSRPFSWQRPRNHRQVSFEESSGKIPCVTVCPDEERLSQKLQYDINNRMHKKWLCTLMLQARLLVTKRDHINRHFMFYRMDTSSSVLPQKHILNSLKPRFEDSSFLVTNIFGLSDISVSAQSMPFSDSSSFCLFGSACLFHSLVKLFKILIRRAQCCQHLRFLDKHCAVPFLDRKDMGNSNSLFEGNELGVKEKSHGFSTINRKKTLDARDFSLKAINPYCLKSQVVSFIWAVCRNIIPADLLGTPHNWRVLRRNIWKFIQLRRFEKFSIKQCMHKLKTSEFPFLSNKHFSFYLNAQLRKDAAGENVMMRKEFNELNSIMQNIKHTLLTNWIFWFFSSLVVPLVQANFYVTESEHGKQDIYYCRNSVWKKLTNNAITNLKDKSYYRLDDAAVRSVISNRAFGFSKLRILPKEDGVRMLANLRSSSRILAPQPYFKKTCSRMQMKAQLCHKHFKSVNYVLRDAHAVLKGLVLKTPDKLGSSVFDYNDVYKKLCPFLIDLRKGSTTAPGAFIVVSDVSKAFDSVDQDKLLRILNDIIREDDYILEQPRQVVCTKKSLWVHSNLILMDENANTCYSRFTSSLASPSLHGILVNQGQRRCVRKEELFFILNEHVKRNVLQLDKKFYLQGMGIPQGSVLSSLLCSLYYGDMERSMICPYIEKTQESAIDILSGSQNSGENTRNDTIGSSPSCMLLRFVDDFLFISTSKNQAAHFFHRLYRGFRDYNCYMKEEKFCVNFDTGHDLALPPNRLFVGEDGITFLRWSGLLINSSTLEVQGDYTRYLNSHLSSALTVCWQGKPAQHLKLRLHGFMRPKCHPIFFDSNINSAAVVRLNIYQAFLLSAMKFHCYISDLSYICNLCATAYLKIIEGSLRYMHLLIRKRMHSLYLGLNLCPNLQLEESEVEWLGLNAYVHVLKRKQSRHKELLPLLSSKLLGHKMAGSVSSQLKYAVDRLHSSLIWKIKY